MRPIRTITAAPQAIAIIGLCVLGSTGSAVALEEAAQIKLGETEYMSHCASCHGVDATGDGPVAEVLSAKPSDLTKITQDFSGVFPDDHIYKVIDGQQMINPHGDRGMPVWGPRYIAAATETAQMVPHDVDAQALAHGRIEALVAYIRSIQAE